ncbi:MAG: hypothetical protein MUF49_18670 [Oculatellaceae cyanobacterium Prado106]|jgi:hypothetical protein|nr:hypothetical protein [Oculatellaceae cyanobacterium Prado106]
MNRFAIFGLTAVGVVSAIAPLITLPPVGYAQIDNQMTYTGSVEQVWEDGFNLNTGDRLLTVDSWDLYGDNTPAYVQVGDRVTVTGEFDAGEFDAFTVTID